MVAIKGKGQKGARRFIIELLGNHYMAFREPLHVMLHIELKGSCYGF